MSMTRVSLRISGEVQGVFYRASAREEAARLRLRGWVRNLASGEVEAEVEGPEGPVAEFIEWCKVGPRTARVERVEVTKSDFRGDLGEFSIMR
jgi:acylphosphatase